MRQPFLCPFSQKPITDPVIVNLAEVAPLVYERSSLIEAAQRGEFDQFTTIVTDALGRRTSVKVTAENIQACIMSFELARNVIKIFEKNPENPVIEIEKLNDLSVDPLTRSFPKSTAFLCRVDGRIYEERSIARLLNSTKYSPLNRKLITDKNTFFSHPLLEILLSAIKDAKEKGKTFINLREIYQDYSSEENYIPFKAHTFKLGYDDNLKMAALMMAGMVKGLTGILPAMQTLPLPAMRFGSAMGLMAHAFNSAEPALLFPQLMHSQGGERLASQAATSKRNHLELLLFSFVVVSQLKSIRFDTAAMEIHGWYDASKNLSSVSNLSVVAFGALYELGVSYAEYWKVSTTLHLLLANREKYANDIRALFQSPDSFRKWTKIFIMGNILLRGALYPLFLKPADRYPSFIDTYFMAVSYFLYRRMDCLMDPRPVERHQEAEPEMSFNMMEWIAKITLFVALLIGSGKILGFGSFELWSMLIVQLGEFAMVAELKDLVSQAPQNFTFVPAEAQNLYRLKARVEILPDNQEEEVQQVVARLN